MLFSTDSFTTQASVTDVGWSGVLCSTLPFVQLISLTENASVSAEDSEMLQTRDVLSADNLKDIRSQRLANYAKQ